MAQERTDGILKGLQMVIEEIGAIGKNKRNDTQKYMFRGIDDVMNTLHPLLAKAHIVIIPHVLDVQRDERQSRTGQTLLYSIARISFDFVSTDDGTKVTAEVVGEGMDSGDKSMNKAMSVAMKYACFQVFCIPTEEMVDPDKESHEVAPKQEAPQAVPQWFVAACKTRANDTTLGKLYKERPDEFYNLKETGTEDQKKAISMIEMYMEGKR